jgi:hypothetical protein
MNNTEEVEKLYSVRRSGSILGGEICLLCGQWGTILLENLSVFVQANKDQLTLYPVAVK